MAVEIAKYEDRKGETQLAGRGEAGRIYFAPILGLALALRLVVLLSIAHGDPRFWFFNQASEYGCLAQSIVSGHGYASPFCGSTGPSAFLAPGYPLLVAMAFRIFGAYSAHAAAALLTMQLLFAELTVLALMLLAKRVLGKPWANLAGFLWAVSPPAVGLPVLFWETSLSVLLLTGVVLAAVYCADHSKYWNWAALGAYSALATLVNPSLLPTFAMVLLWTAWRSGALLQRRLALAIIVWCAMYSAWPIRNEIQMHAFVPFRTNMGYELWQGNRPGSDGTFDLNLHPNASNQEYVRYADLGEMAYMQEKKQMALEAIRADKMRFVRLSLVRFARFWMDTTGYERPSLISANIAFTSLMSLVGLGLMLRRREAIGYLLAIPFVVLPAPYYLTHADFRFRLLLDPMGILLTAYVAQSFRGYLRSRATKRRSSDGALNVVVTAEQS